MTDQQLEFALDLMRRMPPSQIEDNLAWLIDLVPDLTEDLLSAVDQPLQVAHDAASGKDYLLCDYNRDEDSYRSPWSNKYTPDLPDGAVPSDKLRQFEVHANEVFDVYREMYYDGGVSSVYCWELDGGFAVCILIKKGGDKGKKGGSWDSIHVVEVEEKGRTAKYKLTSTIMLSIAQQHDKIGDMSICGSLTRQGEREVNGVGPEKPHVVNIGQMVEDMELKLRQQLETVYFGKTREVISHLRSIQSRAEAKKMEELQKEVAQSLEERRRK